MGDFNKLNDRPFFCMQQWQLFLKVVSVRRALRIFLCTTMIVCCGSLMGQQRKGDVALSSIENNPKYSVFVSAMKQSGLWKTVLAGGELTMFLPDNKALDTHGSRFLLETVLVSMGNEERLADVLSQHLIRGKFDLTRDDFEVEMLSDYAGGCLEFRHSSRQVGLESTITHSVEAGHIMIHFVDGMIGKEWDDNRVCEAKI